MKPLSIQPRAEVLPALYGRPVPPVQNAARTGARLTFEQRATRTTRFPVEQSLARIPEPSRIGRYLDIEV